MSLGIPAQECLREDHEICSLVSGVGGQIVESFDGGRSIESDRSGLLDCCNDGGVMGTQHLTLPETDQVLDGRAEGLRFLDEEPGAEFDGASPKLLAPSEGATGQR